MKNSKLLILAGVVASGVAGITTVLLRNVEVRNKLAACAVKVSKRATDLADKMLKPEDPDESVSESEWNAAVDDLDVEPSLEGKDLKPSFEDKDLKPSFADFDWDLEPSFKDLNPSFDGKDLETPVRGL